MKTKKFTIEENLNSLTDGQTMLNRLVDSQIKNYRLQGFADWERNHNASTEDLEQKIEELKRIKSELNTLIQDVEDDSELTFRLNIEVTVKDQQHSPASMSELIPETA